MEVKIEQFVNRNKQAISGLTPEHAIYDNKGERLDNKLNKLINNIDDIVKSYLKSHPELIVKVQDKSIDIPKLAEDVINWFDLLQTNIDNEADKARLNEQNNTEKINIETNRAKTAENILQTNINNEINRAKTVELAIQTTIDNIVKTGEASSASNVTYIDNIELDSTNLQDVIDRVGKKTLDGEKKLSELEEKVNGKRFIYFEGYKFDWRNGYNPISSPDHFITDYISIKTGDIVKYFQGGTGTDCNVVLYNQDKSYNISYDYAEGRTITVLENAMFMRASFMITNKDNARLLLNDEVAFDTKRHQAMIDDLSAIKQDVKIVEDEINDIKEDIKSIEHKLSHGPNYIDNAVFDWRQGYTIVEDSTHFVTEQVSANVGQIIKPYQDGEVTGCNLIVYDENGNYLTSFEYAYGRNCEMPEGAKSVRASFMKEGKNTAKLLRDGELVFTPKESGGLEAEVKDIKEQYLVNQWYGKTIATYGDSVTACNNGDFAKPIKVINYNWGSEVAKYLNFDMHYGRGIGSTCFTFRPHGGQVAWCNTTTGEYVNRDDSYNYDNYQGNVQIPDNCTAIRGDGCSWKRITTMFPPSIKDKIDVVLIMFHNDFHQDLDSEVRWIDNNTTDTEWAASSYYSIYNGDYNITSVKGGIASVILKLQVWMPQAQFVLMTPISGVYINGNDNIKDLENVESAKMKKLAETVKDIAFRMSIPCIDVYGNDGINSLNKKLNNYITDGIHPYSVEGRKKISRTVISGLIGIVPNL